MYKSLFLNAIFSVRGERPAPSAQAGTACQSLKWLTATVALFVVSTLAGPVAAQSADASGGVANSIHVSQTVTPYSAPRSESGGDGERVETEWRVVVVTGQVRSRVSGGDWLPVAEGRIIGDRTRIETGEDGQLLLFNGRDSIAVSPGTSLVLPTGQQDSGVMSIIQDSGTARYDVESRRSSGSWRHDLVDTGRPRASDAPSAERFQVETPYLAAIVKGTTFSVSVAQDQASVNVHEGLVAVRDSRSGASRDIEAGRAGTVGRRSGVHVTDLTPDPAAGQPPRSPGIGESAQDVVENGVGEEGADGDTDDGRDDDDSGKDDDGRDNDDDGKDDDDDDSGKDDDDDDDTGKDDDDDGKDDDGKDDDGKDDDGKGDDDDGARTDDKVHGRKTGQFQQGGKSEIGCNPVGDCGGDRR